MKLENFAVDTSSCFYAVDTSCSLGASKEALGVCTANRALTLQTQARAQRGRKNQASVK